MGEVAKGAKRFQTGEAIQALHLNQDNHITGAVGVASARRSVGLAVIVRVACDTDMYIKWGDNTVVAAATNILFPAGVENLPVPEGATDLAYIRVTTDGIISITQIGDD